MLHLSILCNANNLVFRGVLYNSVDSTTLSDVHVINYSTEKVTYSLSDGSFEIAINVGDRILFSSIGFQLTELIITDSLLDTDFNKIFLQPEIYMLKSTTVYPYQTYEEFKQAFLNLKTEDNSIELNLPVPVVIKETEPGTFATISLGSPITALYMAYSKEGKELKKYNEIIERDKIEKFVAIKYNKSIVKLITGIEEENELKEFMEYCHLSNEFILKSIDYEIYLAIKNCYEDFISVN